MKIFQNNISPIKTNYNQNFGNNNVTTSSNLIQISKLPDVTPQYSVKTPIAYSHIEDIKLPNELTAHSYKLANGQRVVIVPKKGTTVVKTYVNTGSLNEPDNVRGISHYIEHNLFNGSEALGDKVFFDEVNKMGAETNASTSFSVTDYFIESNLLDDTDLENKIKLQAGMIQTPKFLNEKLQKEKAIVNSEINMCLSDDESRAATLTIKNLFNIKSNAPDLIAGSTDNIDALTRDDVVNYFNNNYYPANMVTVITGEVEPEDTMKLVSKYFNSTKVPSAPRHYETMTPINKSIRQDLISDKTQGAAKIILGFAGPENANSKDRVYLRAVNELLFGLNNARTQKLEQKYSTGVYGFSERLGTRAQDRRANIIETAIPEAYVEPFLKDLYAILNNVVPTQDEFEAIKNNIKKANSVSMQSSYMLNKNLGSDFLDGNTHATADYNDIIDKMTYEDFVNTAKKYYDLNKVALTVVHPVGSTKENIEANYKAAPVSFTGSIKKVPLDIKKVNEYTMGNNFDVTLQDADTDVINYSIVIDKNDYGTHKAAVADVLYDMIQNCATVNHSKEEIDAMFDKNAIQAGVASSSRSLSLFGSSPVEKSQLSLDLFKEKLTAPLLNEEIFKQAIQHCRDNYSTVEPNAGEAYRSSIYKNTQNATSVKERLESLDKISLDDVINLYNEIISNGQGKIVVTAPFNKRPELMQQVFNSAASYNAVKPKDVSLQKSFELTAKPEVHTIETRRNQAEVYEGFKFPVNGNIKDDLCLQILSHILGGSSSSRLFSDLREQRHLAYFVNSSYSNIDDIGVMTLKIETTTNNLETGEKSYDNIKKSIDGFNENISKLRTEKVSDEELQTAKKALKSYILGNLEMNRDQTIHLASSISTPYGINYINQQFEIIDSLTADDILNTAKYVFKQNPVYSISGTKDALEANKEFLNSLVN